MTDKKVQDDIQPQLDAIDEIKWRLGFVEALVVLLDEILLPAHGSDGDEPAERLGKVSIQGRLCFEIEMTDLSRCAQIEGLDKIERGHAEWNDNRNILCAGYNDSYLGNDVEGVFFTISRMKPWLIRMWYLTSQGIKGTCRQRLVYDGHVLAEAIHQIALAGNLERKVRYLGGQLTDSK